MRSKRSKGYWSKRKESFQNSRQARSRAGELRLHEHIEHVTMDKVDERYIVSFSIAKWYAEDLDKAGVRL